MLWQLNLSRSLTFVMYALLTGFLALCLLSSAPSWAAQKSLKAKSAKSAKSSQNTAVQGAIFSENPAVLEFIEQMHAQYGFEREKLQQQFSKIRVNATVLRAIQPAAVPEQQRSWQRYQARFVNERRIYNGLTFWQENAAELARAEAVYGVPAEIIVSIIGVETEYGRNMGSFRVLEALATLAFEYPKRAEFFRSELEQFIILCHENNLDALEVKGSYAGAIGIAQFMPSSLRRFAVDFDADGQIDLRRSRSDAIGSVANYLKVHGWQVAAPIVRAASVTFNADMESENDVDFNAKIAKSAKIEALINAGIKLTQSARSLLGEALQADLNHGEGEFKAALIDLVSPDAPTEYWLGFDNFYVITRYNRSSFYAMSVVLLAEALAQSLRVARLLDESN